MSDDIIVTIIAKTERQTAEGWQYFVEAVVRDTKLEVTLPVTAQAYGLLSVGDVRDLSVNFYEVE